MSEQNNMPEAETPETDTPETDAPETEMPDAETIARNSAEFMADKKAVNITIMDVTGVTDVADYFVLCSAESDTHLKAIASNVKEELTKAGVRPYRTEGWGGGQWVILDYVEVVIHVFHRDAREYYKLERLWRDARIEQYSLEGAEEQTTEQSGTTSHETE